DLPPSDTLRRYTAAPVVPLAALSVSVGSRSCGRRMSGPNAFAELVTPLAGQTDPPPSECPAYAFLLLAARSPPVVPVAADTSRSATVPEFLATAASGNPVTAGRSSHPLPDSLCSP